MYTFGDYFSTLSSKKSLSLIRMQISMQLNIMLFIGVNNEIKHIKYMKQRIRLTESQLNRVIKESVEKVLNEELGKRSIKWDNLLNKVKEQIKNSYNLAMNDPGSYALQRMRSFVDKDEPGYRWNSPALRDKIHDIISRFDVRNVGELIEFCDKRHLSYPKWLKKGATAELTDDGWVLFEK